jgi:hypothetical protein
MYYKIENKECDVYKKLHQMRSEEMQIGKDNLKAIEEKIGLEFVNYLGHNSQQNFRRTSKYNGFEFTEPEKVDLKIWKRHNEHTQIFIPNKRTKSGREMAEFLLNGLKGSIYNRPLKILGLTEKRKFTFPYVEVIGDLIIIYLGNNGTPQDKNVIEITRSEFERFNKTIGS